MKRRSMISISAVLAACGGAPSYAQDSVALTPGNSDALSPYATQQVRYVVDLVPLTGSWGTPYLIGPALKASRDLDPMFQTQIVGATALSPNVLSNQVFPSTSFAFWSAPGAGVHPSENSAPGSVAVTSFGRQFGLSMNDLSAQATNVIGALIGQNTTDLARLFVTRTVAMTSRPAPATSDTATLAIGSIDAHGNQLIRADDYNAAGGVSGENIIRVDLPSRGSGLNTLTPGSPANSAADTAATAFLINNGTTTTNTPALLPETQATAPVAIVLEFAGAYRPDGAPGITSHLDPAIEAHRGNPSFSKLYPFGGEGTVASIARSIAGAGLADSINIFAVDTAGAIVATRSATLPSPITDGSFTTNTSGDAQFLQYLSQVNFRGANGQAAFGRDVHTSLPLAAATATDPTDGEFIAVARFVNPTPVWTIAAHVGKPVLDGPSGSPIGTLIASEPATFSAPAIDRLGNVYFVGAFQPTVGPEAVGLFKAVNTASGGYRLELLLKTGQSFAGANSGRTYTVETIFLGDSDSVASGAFASSSIIQQQITGFGTTDPASGFAFGGAIVTATIAYNNAGTPERYDAVLFIGPEGTLAPTCPGDTNGDLVVDITDLNAVLGNFGTTGEPGMPGDVTGDGSVDISDLNLVLGNFGESC